MPSAMRRACGSSGDVRKALVGVSETAIAAIFACAARTLSVGLAVDEVVALRANVRAELLHEIGRARFLDQPDVHRRRRAVRDDRARPGADVRARPARGRSASDTAARPGAAGTPSTAPRCRTSSASSAESSGTASTIARSSADSGCDAVVEARPRARGRHRLSSSPAATRGARPGSAPSSRSCRCGRRPSARRRSGSA